MFYDNIKSHKKPELYPLSRKYSFEKITMDQIDPSAFLGLRWPGELQRQNNQQKK